MEAPIRAHLTATRSRYHWAVGNATLDGREWLNLRAWPRTRERLRRCCALYQERQAGDETSSRRPPNGLSARLLDRALAKLVDELEDACERERGGRGEDWRRSVAEREHRWKATATGVIETITPPHRTTKPFQDLRPMVRGGSATESGAASRRSSAASVSPDVNGGEK